LKTIRSKLILAESEITNGINEFVMMLNQENNTAYMDNVLGNPNYLLNMSTTAAPDLNNNTGLLTLYLDGLFYDVL
jgi:hypothetical protein